MRVFPTVSRPSKAPVTRCAATPTARRRTVNSAPHSTATAARVQRALKTTVLVLAFPSFVYALLRHLVRADATTATRYVLGMLPHARAQELLMRARSSVLQMRDAFRLNGIVRTCTAICLPHAPRLSEFKTTKARTDGSCTTRQPPVMPLGGASAPHLGPVARVCPGSKTRASETHFVAQTNAVT